MDSQNSPFLASLTHTYTKLTADSWSPVSVTLPDVKRAFLSGAERRGAGTDAAGHHLFPQIMDLRLETTVFCTHRRKNTEPDTLLKA